MTTPYKCADLLKPIEEAIGCNHMLWPDGEFYNGSADTPVRGLLVTWMADVDVLARAVRHRCNVVLCHEEIFFSEKKELPPYRWLTPDAGPLEPQWHPNRKKRALISKHHLTILRCHYGLDRFACFQGITDSLGLKSRHPDCGWESVYPLPRPMTVAALAADIKKRLKISGTVRIAGDLRRKVRRAANLWGGMGLIANVYWLRRGILNGADVGICGEMDEYFMHYALDAGIPVIEVSHQLSEEPGLRYYSDCLRRRLPDLRIVNHCSGRPYQTV